MIFKNIMVTGGAGFIGANFIQYLLSIEPSVKIVNYDALTYAGNLHSLEMMVEPADAKRHQFVRGRIEDLGALTRFLDQNPVDAIINFAAETHVDRSILDSSDFIRTNIEGTRVLLEMAMKYKVQRFLQVSTDEVYGSLGQTGKFTEETPLAPNSPYSASKTAADCLVRAYGHTYQLPVLITRCSNNYGPFQFPEKFIPLMITNLLENKPVPVYGDGLQIRDWLHVQDHCSAIWQVLNKGVIGEVYNIGGSNEWTNIDIVRKVLGILQKPDSFINYVKDRPGHDRRYAIDSSKTQALGWRPTYDFDIELANTVSWYQSNRDWWEEIRSGEYREYREYYERQYGV